MFGRHRHSSCKRLIDFFFWLGKTQSFAKLISLCTSNLYFQFLVHIWIFIAWAYSIAVWAPLRFASVKWESIFRCFFSVGFYINFLAMMKFVSLLFILFIRNHLCWLIFDHEAWYFSRIHSPIIVPSSIK